MIATHGNHAHGFRAARNDHLGEACQDAFGGESNRLKSGGAEAIDGHRRDRHWQPSTQRRDAGHIIALFGLGHCATQDNVLHFVAVERRHTPQGFPDRGCCHVIRPRRAQDPARRLADRCARNGNNHGFTHIGLLLKDVRDPWPVAVRLLVIGDW